MKKTILSAMIATLFTTGANADVINNDLVQSGDFLLETNTMITLIPGTFGNLGGSQTNVINSADYSLINVIDDARLNDVDQYSANNVMGNFAVLGGLYVGGDLKLDQTNATNIAEFKITADEDITSNDLVQVYDSNLLSNLAFAGALFTGDDVKLEQVNVGNSANYVIKSDLGDVDNNDIDQIANNVAMSNGILTGTPITGGNVDLSQVNAANIASARFVGGVDSNDEVDGNDITQIATNVAIGNFAGAFVADVGKDFKIDQTNVVNSADFTIIGSEADRNDIDQDFVNGVMGNFSLVRLGDVNGNDIVASQTNAVNVAELNVTALDDAFDNDIDQVATNLGQGNFFNLGVTNVGTPPSPGVAVKVDQVNVANSANLDVRAEQVLGGNLEDASGNDIRQEVYNVSQLNDLDLVFVQDVGGKVKLSQTNATNVASADIFGEDIDLTDIDQVSSVLRQVNVADVDLGTGLMQDVDLAQVNVDNSLDARLKMDSNGGNGPQIMVDNLFTQLATGTGHEQLNTADIGNSTGTVFLEDLDVSQTNAINIAEVKLLVSGQTGAGADDNLLAQTAAGAPGFMTQTNNLTVTDFSVGMVLDDLSYDQTNVVNSANFDISGVTNAASNVLSQTASNVTQANTSVIGGVVLPLGSLSQVQVNAINVASFTINGL